MANGELENEINRHLWLIVSPILLVVGTIGNFMSIAVMSRANMRASQASVYLIALSLADIVVLYTGLIRYFIREVSGVDIRHFSGASCRLHTMLVYMSLDISVWILVVFTGERILSVFMPYKVKNICTRVTSLVLIAVIVVVMFILNCHFLYGMIPVTTVHPDNSTSTHPCTYVNGQYQDFMLEAWPWIDFCVFNLVPFTLLSIGNSCVAFRVIASRRRTKKVGSSDLNPTTINGLFASSPAPNTSATTQLAMAASTPPVQARAGATAANSSLNAPGDPRQTRKAPFTCSFTPTLCLPAVCVPPKREENSPATVEAANRPGPAAVPSNRVSLKLDHEAPPIRSSSKNDRTSSMTAILLLLNMVFLATTTPVSIFFIIQDDWAQKITNHKQLALFRLTFTIVNLIQYMNNSINFILYCITGSRFRKELQAMLFKKHRVFPALGEGAARRVRPLDREVTGLHTRLTIASDVVAEEQVPVSRNNLHVPGTKTADTHI